MLEQNDMGAMHGIRVLDVTRILAGPWATQIFADMGAEVIKIERPKTGDDVRAAGPPFLHDKEGRETTDSAYFLSANRGKKSVTLNIATPEGQDIIRKLAASCDIFMENYKVGTLKRYGLDYESLREINPRLIYCSITGFGQTGPLRDRPGYDFIFQGMGGLMSITGERDDLPGGGPQKLGVAFADLMTGMYTAVAVLGALNARQRTGKGQHIDLALFDVVVGALANMNLNYLVSGKIPGRMGNAHANLVPYQVFRCADGHLIIAVGNDRQFADLCLVLGRSEWTEDERFRTNPSRIRNRDVLIPMLQEELLRHNQADLIAALEERDVSCGPINNIKQALEHPQTQAREMVITVPHELAGSIRLIANPIKYSDTPMQYGTVPVLGANTTEVLTELCGLNEEQIHALREKGII